MSDIAVKIENLSKQYRLGLVGTNTLRGDLQRFWWKVTGKGDPTLKIDQENNIAKAGGDYVWALRDINLEIKKGEVLGIIGKNGAGKSTLLKILSRVTGPTKGSVKINGRLASLLEVGTGFHPELTGRENIFLNSALFGFTEKEINNKFDSIVKYSGLNKFINSKLITYSTGMIMRLAFSVAIHTNFDILLIDEVIAVGDIAFQKQCNESIAEFIKQKKTIIIVSHNLAVLRCLCNRAIHLVKGKLIDEGNINDILDRYEKTLQ